METKYYTLHEKKEIKEMFLIIPDEFKKYLKYKDEIYWIYKILDIDNNKVYIGKTKDINVRALTYINAYLKGETQRTINKVMNLKSIDKFIMTPLEVAFNSKSGIIKEKYYIDLYDSIKNGYNTNINSTDVNYNRKAKVSPNKQTIYAKISKSKLCCAVNEDKKEIVFSTGLKLFGDYINRHKDEIKSVAKRETKMEGYFVYYLNEKDLNSQLNDAENKILKNSIYSDCNLLYPDFIKYAKYIKNILINKHNNPENFKLIFITQDNSEKGYKFENIDIFMDVYKTYGSSII